MASAKMNRPRGVLNFEDLIDAMTERDSDGRGEDCVGYMEMLATKYPRLFLTLLGDVLRLEIKAEVEARKRDRYLD
jgi:hypothetical protein